ncbi:unnamed protein product [Durusdinium trenchii]|uniref:ubiquitinyl hydrolase 1 n=1 Tax=Durusdinium trenchii TaxID=1381693 RepID=A0ABP0KPA0_9DINO
MTNDLRGLPHENSIAKASRAPSQSQVVAALQRVFALLSEGESLVVDPKDFVTAARVDALEQADATEFSALLLDWLQRELSAGGGAEFIPALFEGQSSTIVQCSQDPSHFSEKPESFMELRAGLSPVAVALEAKEATGRKSGPKTKPGAKKSNKKLPTIRLEQILEETAFPEEVLDGSNQWLCPRCDRKVDAKRTTRLSKLPPYLHVTVERYHFEAETAQRKRLAHPVSFPRRLELRLGGALASQRPEATSSETAMLPVAYECIGYLEHVSDSAHSGHYRATLLREEEEPYVSAVAGLVGDEVKEPALKRPKVDDPDAAAGAPQKRSWWRLDDESVTPVESVESEASGAGAPKAAEGTSSSSAAPPQASDPERIESATAYLVLYRRCDHDPGQLCQGRRVSGVPRTAPPLSSELQRCVDEHNTELRRQRKEFESNSLAVERFVGERRRAVMCLAEALRALHPSQGSSSDLNLVPSPWLERFLRGEDRTLQNILEGDASIQPPIYSSSLIQGRTGHALDPLAVWCGEVKLLPTAALEQVGGQFGGLDSSTFLRAEAAMNEEVATLVFKAFEHFRKEFHLKGVLQSNRFSVTDVRAVESSEQGFAVWISIRQLNQWKKVVGDTSSTASLRQLWRCFVQEVHEYRFGISPEGGAADAPEASDDEVAVEASGLEVPSDVKEATTPRVKPLTLLGGLLCRHQLLSRPRAAALVSRSQLEELLERLPRAVAKRCFHAPQGENWARRPIFSGRREAGEAMLLGRPPEALRPWSASGATPAASDLGDQKSNIRTDSVRADDVDGSKRKGSGGSKRSAAKPGASGFGGKEAPLGGAAAASQEESLALSKPMTGAQLAAAEVNGAGGMHRVIPTPGNLIGGLMGRGGATITAIRKNHPGVTIKVNQPQGNAMAEIIITGDPKMVPSAEVAVCEALMSSPSKGAPVMGGRGVPQAVQPR